MEQLAQVKTPLRSFRTIRIYMDSRTQVMTRRNRVGSPECIYVLAKTQFVRPIWCQIPTSSHAPQIPILVNMI